MREVGGALVSFLCQSMCTFFPLGLSVPSISDRAIGIAKPPRAIPYVIHSAMLEACIGAGGRGWLRKRVVHNTRSP